MIAAWIVYSLAVGALLYASARALEIVAHALNLATRFIWVAAIAAAFALSTRELVRLANGLDTPAPSLERRIARRVRSATPVVIVKRQLEPIAADQPIGHAMKTALVNAMYELARTRGALHGVDVAPFDRWNRTLLASWFVGSAALAGFLVVAFGRLREMERDFEPASIDGVQVVLSRDVGPALFGFVRPRIVLPRWVLELSPTERRIILAHEREHGVARDPATLVGALLMLVVQPWNLALWAMLSRLRLAIEMDCDRRVLGRTADARRYGELLVLVHSRQAFAAQPLLSFVERRSNLERRIRRITSRRPSLRTAMGGLMVAGLSLVVAAWTPGPTPTGNRRIAEPAADLPSTRPLETTFSGGSLPNLGGPTARTDNAAWLGAKPVQSEPCGIGVRASELCSLDGPMVVRMMDSLRVLVGVKELNGSSTSAFDHLFLVTALEPVSKLVDGSIAHGHIEFETGWLFIVDRDNPQVQVIFGPTTSQIAGRHPAATRIDRLIGLAHYVPAQISLDDIRDLVPCPASSVDGCFTTRQRQIEFP
jgi:beta-lactamase regulating signal transducer with metallopeptidase domain